MKSWAIARLALPLLALPLLALPMMAAAPDWRQDAVLRAMADELARSKTISLSTLDKPYFIQYTADETEELVVDASLGGITRSSLVHVRRPGAQVRVGDYKFDNSNSVYSRPLRFGLFPLDDDYLAMRTTLWRTTDVLYKAATDQITRKRNIVREVADPDKIGDLAAAKPAQVIEPLVRWNVDREAWNQVARAASARFSAYPEITTSGVKVEILSSTYRMLNSEGTVVRIPQTLNEVDVRSAARSADGHRVWNHQFVVALDAGQLPGADKLAKVADNVAAETASLAKAPLAEDYAGPVLFEGEAAAEMIAQTLTDALVLHRKPIVPPGANQAAFQSIESVWAARVGSSVAPDWMSISDNPLDQDFQGTRLAGHYLIDDEGVPGQRVSLVEQGKLRNFLFSRMPVRKFSGSNGHGRLPGPFGSEEAVIGNLFVESAQPVSEAQLKTQLIEKVKAAGLKYGVILRRLDFPSTASLDELQSMAQQLQKNGYARTLNQPLLAYREYPDGREELVRGFRFREFSAKDLRDVAAASDQPYVLNYVNNGSSLNIADLRSEAALSSIVCPSLLFDSVELAQAENEGDAAPLVPVPALVAAGVSK